MLRTHVIMGRMLLLSCVPSGMRTESGTREGLEPIDDAVSIENENVSHSVVTPWTVTCQAPLSMDFSRQEYWSGLPFLSPRYLPHPGIWPRIQTLFSCTVGGFFTIWATREAQALWMFQEKRDRALESMLMHYGHISLPRYVERETYPRQRIKVGSSWFPQWY